MDREYLENYKHEEDAEIERLFTRIQEGRFSFGKDRFPPDERFVNLRNPVGSLTLASAEGVNLWATIPFCGSLIFNLSPLPKREFEKYFFEVSQIPKVVDFIRETGRLQVALNSDPLDYEGLDYLDPFFLELNPPTLAKVPTFVYGTEKEIKDANDKFFTLARVKYSNFLNELSRRTFSQSFKLLLDGGVEVYTFLKLFHTYHAITEEVENLMIDDPARAFILLCRIYDFVVRPTTDIRCDMASLALSDIKRSQILPDIYQPREIRFPCEIGKFLIRKLTYAPKGMRACYDLIDHYDAYDLQKVQASLNEAIVTNHPNIVNKSTKELSEILDNVWNDPEIPKLVKNLRRGIPMSIAAIGTGVSAFAEGLEGFLAGLGFSVGAKFLDVKIEGLSERIAKWLTRSYQANVYDFKKRYKHRIVSK